MSCFLLHTDIQIWHEKWSCGSKRSSFLIDSYSCKFFRLQQMNYRIYLISVFIEKTTVLVTGKPGCFWFFCKCKITKYVSLLWTKSDYGSKVCQMVLNYWATPQILVKGNLHLPIWWDVKPLISLFFLISKQCRLTIKEHKLNTSMIPYFLAFLSVL